MAESASNPNVEDVLSSVRRLVSQEIPRRTPSKPPEEPGALLLSSKDRIEADHSERVAARSLEQRIAELEAAVDKTATDFEPDGSEDQAQHRPDRIVYTRPQPSDAEQGGRSSTLRLSEIAVIETDVAAEAGETSETPVEFRRADPVPVAEGSEPEDASEVMDADADVAPQAEEASSADEAPMAEDVPTLPAATADLHVFSDPDDVVARIEARIERGGDADAIDAPEAEPRSESDAEFDAKLDAAVRASLAALEDDDPERREDAADTRSLEDVDGGTEADPSAEDLPERDPIAASEPETAVKTISEQTSETAPTPVVDVAQAAVLTARARALKESATQPKPTRASRPGARSTLEEAEAVLGSLADEDAMRLLIGRMMRDELQGALGERITQSVRKLVRSEVKRVLESRALD